MEPPQEQDFDDLKQATAFILSHSGYCTATSSTSVTAATNVTFPSDFADTGQWQ